MRLITKIRKADAPKKTEIFCNADLSRYDAMQLVAEMVLHLPKGYYKLHSREYGTNLIDTVYETYGWMPSLLVDEPLLLGLAVLYPRKIRASFTHDMDAIHIM
jgi:hypothetical protein